MTTEERLLKLEGMVEAVVRLLPERMASLENRLEAFRQELKGEIQGLRQELKAEINTAFNRTVLIFTALA
ncbi:MAG: DUF1640 domain-containing protein, partial [Thermus sp.]|nr:DUF1640 domain-containing protein [Thermus sp.]